MKTASLIAFFAAALLCGCVSSLPPEAEALLQRAYERAVEYARKHAAAQADGDVAAPSSESEPPAAGNPATAEAPSSAAATADAPKLVWKFGSFDGSRALEDPATQIKDLHMTKSGMSYRWAKGDLGNWGLARSDAGALACAFYWDESAKAWIGGKFDWISTSRTTRDFKNLEDYKGWSKGPFFAAPKRAFCIVAKNGRVRTNLLETKEP